MYNQTAFDIYMEDMPGQKYSLDLQCVHINGPGSYFCGVSGYKRLLSCKILPYLKYAYKALNMWGGVSVDVESYIYMWQASM